MAISVTLPITAPTNLQATLQAGGSLAANTTYYYIVIAYDQTSFTPAGVYCYHSPISAEGSFTTDTTNKSVKINWTNVSGATRYQILLSTTSGNYTNSGGYGTAAENIGSISDGSTGYTITVLSSEAYVFHTCQIVNALPANINKNLGLIKVDFSTAGNITLDQVYDAIVASGFSDYVSYDGYNFILKGWFYASGSATAGTFNPTRKRFIFVKGGVINQSNTYIMRFGTWTSDIVGANYSNGCSIDILNARTPFYGSYDKLQVYGSLVTYGQSMYLKLTENKTIGNFLFGMPYINNVFTEIKDNILGIPGRGVTSDVKDLKWAQQNNFGNGKHIRLDIYTLSNLPYTQGGSFYNCKWQTYPTKLQFYSGIGGGYNTSGHYSNFYDNEFIGYTDGMIKQHFQYTSLEVANPTSNQYVIVNYSLNATVLDEKGKNLQGVNVSAIDCSGNSTVWIEYFDASTDKIVTGRTFNSDVSTNANGQIAYFLKSYQINLDPSNSVYPISSNLKITDFYPYTITFSKDGYRDYKVILDDFNKKTDMTLTLEDYEPPIFIDQRIEGSIIQNSLTGVIKNNKLSGTVQAVIYIEEDN